jgi:hypothetical protein
LQNNALPNSTLQKIPKYPGTCILCVLCSSNTP